MILVTQSVASRDVLDADDRGNITRVARLDILAFISLDLNQSADSLALVRPWIVNVVAFGQRARIDTEEDELTNERIAPEFEGKGTERAVVIRWRLFPFVRIRVHSNRSWNIDRARQVIDDRIHQILNTFILES